MLKNIEKKKLIIYITVGIIAILAIIKILDNNYKKEDENAFNTNLFSQPEAIEETEEKIIVYITGEVVNQGVIELNYGSRISDAIEKAGGLTENANIHNVNLAYELEDGQKIYIPNINEQETIIVNEPKEELNEIGEKDEIININKADPNELQSLNGIGVSLANNIIQYRKKNGKFKKIEDLMNVPGIGKNKFNNIKEYIKVK